MLISCMISMAGFPTIVCYRCTLHNAAVSTRPLASTFRELSTHPLNLQQVLEKAVQRVMRHWLIGHAQPAHSSTLQLRFVAPDLLLGVDPHD